MEILTLENSVAQIESEAINTFRTALTGTLLQPGDPDYEDARHIWNGMIERRPALIAQCESADDVITAVNFARAHELLLSIHGGGHNVAGHAIADNGLVIDLSPLTEVTVNPNTNTVSASGGATIADLDRATQKHGLAVPMGVVSQTGIAGLTLGGGIGWLRRKFGLSCDNLVAADVVTADGTLLTASANENADLFWGLQGGGGNFGVVTRFTFQAHPIGPEVMFVFTFYPGQKIRAALRYYRDFCANAPDEVTSFAICGDVPPEEDFPAEIHGQPYVLFAACYAGPVAAGRRALQPLREFDRENGGPMLDFSGPMDYANEVQTILDADYPDGMRYYWKSCFLENLADDVIDAIIEQNENRPGALSTVDIWHMGGAIDRVDAAESAFGGRQAPYLLGVEANWEEKAHDETNIAWARTAVKAMSRFSSGAEYLNFPGFLEAGDRTMRATFGQKYERLAKVKQKYDPDNLFRMNQNIQVPASLQE